MTGCSNYTVEYQDVIAVLELALQLPIVSLTIYGNSKLIVKQPARRVHSEKGRSSSLS